MMILLVEFFNIPVPLNAGVESIFSLGIQTFFAQRGLSDAQWHIFKSLSFLQEIIYLLFTNLAACIICFEYWFCTAA